MFNGFSDETFEFFMAIGFNNNREFFQENHDWYLRSVRQPALALAESLSESIEKMDPDMERRPNRVVSRINRDIRFSNDKSPYRDYIWLAFRRPEVESGVALSAYFDMSCDGASYGLSFYRDNRPLMNAFRRRLAAEPEEFLAIWRALSPEFVLHANAYKRMAVPDPLPPEARPWYPLKGFYVQKDLRDFALIKSPALAEEIQQGFEKLIPLYRCLSQLKCEEGGNV